MAKAFTPRNRFPVKKEALHKINEFVLDHEVRLVGDNVTPGIVSNGTARALAKEQELDLVVINATTSPPICRIVDYTKFLYDAKKKAKELKAKAKTQEVKEIRFGPTTAENDFQTKLKHAREFLEAGDKIKAHVMFRGRAIVHKDLGEVLLLRFAQALEDIAKVEQLPKLEGKKMFLFLSPKLKKK